MISKLKAKDFNIITFSDYSISDQIKLFYNANNIVGLHGAGFANIVFCNPNTKIIELRGIHSGKQYENLSKTCGLNYTSITVEAEQNFPNQQGGIRIPNDRLAKLIENF